LKIFYSSKQTYSHGSHKVCWSLFESETLRDGYRDQVRDRGLHNEDNWNNGQFHQFISIQLLSQFRENYLRLVSIICLLDRSQLTQTGCEESYVQIRHELLLVCIEHSLPRNDVSWQTDTYHLHHSFEDQQYEMAEGGVGFMVVCSPCEEGECAVGDGSSVIACNNGIESEGGRVGEEPHLVMRIDGLDRALFDEQKGMPSECCGRGRGCGADPGYFSEAMMRELVLMECPRVRS
jgi:hypothetical protein